MEYYTHPSVFEGITAGADWADPVMNPEEIDWPPRVNTALIPFPVVHGRPVNPVQPHLPAGRNEFGHWAEAKMADALVTAYAGGTRHLLMIERGDGHGWAAPGGHVEPGEAPAAAALRELEEETGLRAHRFPFARALAMPARYVPDPRASREAWAVTVPVHIDLPAAAGLPPVHGTDDARRAAWIPAASFSQLARVLEEDFGGVVFPAHTEMLAEFLNHPQ
jgi:8-oxo-dGTP pyrophosphatase MutT (NUDIX family)